MRDVRIITPSDDSDWNLDIDLINGVPDYLDTDAQSNDQRAALAAATIKGTVPTLLGYGVSWGDVFTRTASIVQFGNEITQQIQEYANSTDANVSYSPLVVSSEEGVGAVIYKGNI